MNTLTPKKYFGGFKTVLAWFIKDKQSCWFDVQFKDNKFKIACLWSHAMNRKYENGRTSKETIFMARVSRSIFDEFWLIIKNLNIYKKVGKFDICIFL